MFGLRGAVLEVTASAKSMAIINKQSEEPPKSGTLRSKHSMRHARSVSGKTPGKSRKVYSQDSNASLWAWSNHCGGTGRLDWSRLPSPVKASLSGTSPGP